MTESGFRPTGTPDLAVAKSHNDFAMLEPREQLATLLKEHVVGRPFSELAAVTFDHRAATVMGHVLIDALEDAGYSIDDFDAVGALTAASVPMVSAMIQAAASRGEDLDGFVMDFVYPSIKGPSIEGRRVVLLDAWLSEKSYVQTSSLVTLRNGNVKDPKYTKVYAEKIMMSMPGQVSPMHFHWNKMEDIIVRGGGTAVFHLYNADPETEERLDTPVLVCRDGRRYYVPAGEDIELNEGESLTFYPYTYHEYYIKEDSVPTLVGEVSMCNDDNIDNRFYEPVGRFPEIEEDEPAYRLLCNEYPAAKED